MSEQITTRDELDALPVGSVVASHSYPMHDATVPFAFQRHAGGWYGAGYRRKDTHPDNFLPVTVLFRPDAPRPTVTTEQVSRAIDAACIEAGWDWTNGPHTPRPDDEMQPVILAALTALGIEVRDV